MPGSVPAAPFHSLLLPALNKGYAGNWLEPSAAQAPTCISCPP
ncbi:hypothetical protein [Nevskia ramosa]|nr:hypothetical protein [Nevskia ramosa]